MYNCNFLDFIIAELQKLGDNKQLLQFQIICGIVELQNCGIAECLYDVYPLIFSNLFCGIVELRNCGTAEPLLYMMFNKNPTE